MDSAVDRSITLAKLGYNRIPDILEKTHQAPGSRHKYNDLHRVWYHFNKIEYYNLRQTHRTPSAGVALKEIKIFRSRSRCKRGVYAGGCRGGKVSCNSGF